MSEVSCRAFDLFVGALRELDIPLARFLDGLPVTEAQLLDKNGRITWETYALLCERLESVCGDRLDLEEIGARFLDTPSLKGIAQAVSLFASIRTLYWAAQRFSNPRLFSIVEGEFEVTGPCSLRVRATIPEPYRPSPGYFRLAAGTLRAAPRMLGLPDSRVTIEMKSDRCCDFFVTHAPSRTIWSRIRQAYLAIFAARSLFDELRAQNDELVDQLREVSEAKRTAEEASRLKSTFLANMTHEIRTPMNGVLGMTDLVLEGSLAPEQRAHVEMIRSSSSALMQVLDEVITYSQIEAGHIELKHSDFDPEALANRALASIRSDVKAKGLATSIIIDPMIPRRVRADVDQIQRILNDLVGNAGKFTERGQIEVCVKLERLNGAEQPMALRFEVRDTGIGVLETTREVLFHPFVQADGSLARKHGGLGLGLAIAKQLVELMGGEIDVASRVGEGSTFWFTVPVGRALSISSIPPEATTGTIPRLSTGSLDIGAPTAAISQVTTDTIPSSDTPPAPKPACTGPMILVAEDNLVNQKVLVNILQRLGYRTDVAMNGREAVEAYQKNTYAAILMDLQMPEMTGFEAAVLIRKIEGPRHIPIIAVTANSEEEFAKRAFDSGMDAHLSKPIQKKRLEAELARFLEPRGNA